MTSGRWKDLAELIGILAIVASLVFVGLQMRLDRQLATAALRAEAYQLETDRWLAEMGENPSDVLAKAAVSPDSLNPADIYVLDAWTNWNFSMLRRNQALEDIGLTDPGWRQRVLPHIGRRFASNEITRKILLDRDPGVLGENWLADLQGYAKAASSEEHVRRIEELMSPVEVGEKQP